MVRFNWKADGLRRQHSASSQCLQARRRGKILRSPSMWDASANRRAINPNVYGTAHADTATLTDLNIFLNRNGGNNTSRYNWNVNADQSRQRLVLRKHRRHQRHPRRTGRYLYLQQQKCWRASHADHPDDRLVRKIRDQPQQAQQFLHRQIRRADGQRLAVVPGCRQRRSEQHGAECDGQ